MSDETFDVWPHDPTQIVKEALREYVGDGDGEDERVLAAHEKRVHERIARNIEARKAQEEQTPFTLESAGVVDGLIYAARIAREGA